METSDSHNKKNDFKKNDSIKKVGLFLYAIIVIVYLILSLNYIFK
jgi:hypothetical protein